MQLQLQMVPIEEEGLGFSYGSGAELLESQRKICFRHEQGRYRDPADGTGVFGDNQRPIVDEGTQQ